MGLTCPSVEWSPPGIIELLDVIEDVRASCVARCIRLAIHPLLFQRGEEGFNRRIIPTVATPTHAARDTFGRQQALKVFTGVLTALVGMVQQFGGLAASP